MSQKLCAKKIVSAVKTNSSQPPKRVLNPTSTMSPPTISISATIYPTTVGGTLPPIMLSNLAMPALPATPATFMNLPIAETMKTQGTNTRPSTYKLSDMGPAFLSIAPQQSKAMLIGASSLVGGEV